jgi:hypothetical protein
MRPNDLGKMLLAMTVLLLCICAGASGQQAPAVPPANAAEPATDQPGTDQKGAAAKPALPDDPLPPSGDTKVGQPAIDGVKTIVVKDERDLPKRKNLEYEDWSYPELPSHMKMDAVPLLKSEQKGFTREMISVQWRDLDPIDLWVIKPAGAKNPPVILYLYSYSTSANAHYKDTPVTTARYKNDEFCQFVTRNGFAAVGFASGVTEARFHDRPTRDTFVNQLPEALATTTHDVQMILNYLAKRGDLDMSRVGMWGDGSGASVAIMAAAVDPRIKALDLLDPWGDWPQWLAKSSLVPETERADLTDPVFLRMVENLDPLSYLPKLKTQQVRLQHIKQGITVTPDAVRAKMEAAAPSNVMIVHYDNPKAFFTDVAAKGTSFDWIKGKLGSVAAGQDNHPQNATAAAEAKGPAK